MSAAGFGGFSGFGFAVLALSLGGLKGPSKPMRRRLISSEAKPGTAYPKGPSTQT